MPDSPSPDALAAFDALWQHLGFVPLLLQRLGPLPRAIEAQASLAHVLVVAPGALPQATKTEILSIAAAPDRPSSPTGLSPRDTALLAFAGKLSHDPAAVGPDEVAGLRAHGIGDEEILEAVLATGLGRLFATLAAGFGSRVLPASAPSPAAATGAPARTCPHLGAPERSPSDFEPFAFLQKTFGFVPRLYRAQTLKPEAIEAEALVLREALLDERHLSRVQKERILLAAAEGCCNEYGVALHGRILQLLGSSPNAGFSDGDRALLETARHLADRFTAFGEGDRERLSARGFSEAQIGEAVAVTALAGFLDTVQAGLGVPPDFRPKKNIAPATPATNLSGSPDHPTGDERSPRGPVDDPDAPAVASARNGDMAAFEGLVKSHQGRVYRTLMGITGHAEDSQDGTQAVFIKVFRKLQTFTGEARFSTWLTRIAINEGLERLRSRRREESFDDRPEEDFRPSNLQPWVEDPESRFAREEMRKLVAAALECLPPAYRAAVVLRDIDQLSGSEAAAVLNIPLPTLKTRLLRGRLMLREALAAHMATPRRQAVV
ncbi:MAG TPA: sigma-70 family RNA polymerase sigma factor [Thermoanaerobaculia bacterium]|nr:sigma-70 family RNA polymerase sigma factor [Thermoanaerobaculia bacterium]